MAKGSIQQAPRKEEKLAASVFGSLISQKKGKKARKGQSEANANENSVDFQIIKKFGALKLTVPIKEEDFEKTVVELDQLRDALIYWGKII